MSWLRLLNAMAPMKTPPARLTSLLESTLAACLSVETTNFFVNPRLLEFIVVDERIALSRVEYVLVK